MTLTNFDLAPRVGSEIVTDIETLLSGSHVAALRALLEQRGVLLFRGIDATDEQQLAFARTLGTIRFGSRKETDTGILKVTFDKTENPEFADYFRGTFYWHMDGPLEDVPPLASLLTPRVLAPQGGETEFANTYAAYDDLPEAEKKRFETLQILHTAEAAHRWDTPNPTPEQLSAWRSAPTKVHPLVWRHRSGRKSLVLSTSCASVVGMEKTESDALLAELLAWITRPEYVYRHVWQLGDLLIWDNTGTMHRVLAFDENCGRRLHRVTLEGEERLAAA